MIKLKLLELKSTMEKNGETVLDLAEPTLRIQINSTNYVIRKIMLVTEELAMRPDLISKVAYGVDDYLDLILKANEISNPYSIDIGDLILIPDDDIAASFYKGPDTIDQDKVNRAKGNNIDGTKMSEKDVKRIEKLSKIAANRVNGSKEITQPTVRKAGDKLLKTQNSSTRISPNK